MRGVALGWLVRASGGRLAWGGGKVPYGASLWQSVRASLVIRQVLDICSTGRCVAVLDELSCSSVHFVSSLFLFSKQNPTPPPSANAAPPPSRRSSILGDIVETTGTTPFPEPEADDFFQGDNWEWLGSAAAVAVPALVLAAVAVGAFAARTYDSGADSVLLPASGEDRPAVVVPVEEFDRKVAEMSR